MFKLYEKVTVNRIEKVTGIIVDIDDSDGRTVYTVESDKETTDEFGTLYPLFYCNENELETAQ